MANQALKEKLRGELNTIANVERAIQLMAEIGLPEAKVLELQGKLKAYQDQLENALA